MDSTKRNLLIIVGADSFPKAGLESHQVFRKSARDFRDYMSQYVSDTLDLFNDERPCLAQVEQIENWLQDKAQDSWDSLFFYYVGHGMVNRNQDFYMAIRDTRRPYDYYSSIQGSALAIALRDWIATKPIAMILDCCFAGAIRNTMGSVEAELNANLSSFVQETKRSARGVVQLCAAGKDFTASALDETANYTMFTGAILHVLRTGMKGLGPRLTLLDLADGARKYIREQFPSQAVDPVASVSEAIGGESFAAQPFFINNSFRGGAIQTSTSSPVRHASGPAGRRKALSLNTSWRDWFSKDEIRVAVALSQWFRTSEEACEHIFQNVSMSKDQRGIGSHVLVRDYTSSLIDQI